MRGAINGIIMVVALLVSGGTLLRDFSEGLELDEGVISGVTAALVGLAGIWSVYVARFAKRLPTKPRIFLSYSHRDAEQASMLKEAMLREGAYVWSYDTELVAGQNYSAAIDAAIESSNSVVLMISGSVGLNVKAELDAAHAKKVPVLVVGQEENAMLEGRGAAQVFQYDPDYPNFDNIAAKLVHASEGRSTASTAG